MRVLLVWAAAPVAIRDVTTGLRAALVRAGHQVRDYRLDNRLELLTRAFPAEWQSNIEGLTRMASEGVLAEATYHRADYVLVVSGLQFHEIGLWLLDHYDIPIAVVMTESPYQDADQVRWIGAYQRAVVFTHERVSAKRYGWNYLPHAYDPAIHRPVPPDPDEVCDVLLVGSGWPERQQLLEAVDWTGIDLKLRGHWPGITPGSRLFEQVVRYYLAHPEERAQAAALAQRLVQGETFDRRVETLIECLETAALAQV